MMSPVLQPRAIEKSDQQWVQELIDEHWGSSLVVVHGERYRPAELPGFVVEHDNERIGLLTYHIVGDSCELVTLNSLKENLGAGTALVEAARAEAQNQNCRRLWLVTSNDNTDALRFYQKRGFVLVALHIGAVAQARAIKPEIPLIGNNGIAIRDEIELETRL